MLLPWQRPLHFFFWPFCQLVSFFLLGQSDNNSDGVFNIFDFAACFWSSLFGCESDRIFFRSCLWISIQQKMDIPAWHDSFTLSQLFCRLFSFSFFEYDFSKNHRRWNWNFSRDCLYFINRNHYLHQFSWNKIFSFYA